MKSLHQILKPLVRPLIAIQFVVITTLDYIVLPIVDAFKGVEHVPFTTPEFFAAYGVYLAVYAHGRSKEKISGCEPDSLER